MRYSKLTIFALTFLPAVLGLAACAAGSAQQGTVACSPVIIAQPAILNFSIPHGSQEGCVQALSIVNKGAGEVSWVIGDNSPWITIQQVSNSGNAQEMGVNVSVNAMDLHAGDYTGIITITSEGALNSPVAIPVFLTVVAGDSVRTVPLPVAPAVPGGQSSSTNLPPDSAVIWQNESELIIYADINACLVKGSITNTDKIWYMGNIRIVTESGASAKIADTLQPGEKILYYRYIPCFKEEDVRLDYRWYRP